MKNNPLLLVRFPAKLICLLIIILIQLPAISPAFNQAEFQQPNNDFIFSTKAKPALSAIFAASPTTVFSNTNPISITDRGSGTAPNGVSNPYPSTIAVSGLSGTLSTVTVTLNDFTSQRPIHHDFALVGPGGQTLMLMSDAGDLLQAVGVTNVDLTFSDAAMNFVPSANNAAIPSGTYKPTNVVGTTAPAGSPDNDAFPLPGPSSINSPAPTGSATLTSVFQGINPNGTWSLYAIDDALGGGTSTVSGGWSLDITTAGGVAATTTTVNSSLNPALTTQSVTFTASVTSAGNPVTTGTVSFTQNSVAIAGCSNVTVNNVSGQATCTANAGALPQGTLTITATYNGTASFGVSSGNVTQTVNSPTIVTGSQFCNNGGITLTDNSAANPYPANITVSGLVGTISKVTVNLNGLTLARSQELDLLLVGPGNQAFKFLADVGDANAVSNINLTIDDAAGAAMPIGTALTGGTFRPTDGTGAGDNFPAPAPATVNAPAPTGTATFASVYNTINPNGNWALYAVDDALGGAAGSLTGFCLNFTLAKFTTTTTVASSMNPANQGQGVTFTATVTPSGGTPSGLVEFFNGATSLGVGTVNSGQATLTTSTLPVGTRSITAKYLGANVGAGGGGFTDSTSGVLSQNIVAAPTSGNATVSGRVLSMEGRGVRRALVTITDSSGNSRTAITNTFGYYRFREVPVGSGYIIGVRAKGKRFTTQFMSINEEIDNLNFVETR